ncbi:FAD-dependent oxidoreductase [Streptomyces sp. NPDC057684]|uniref:FAD-dependent oxidoreductase n=1 Tax=unclassified Streptomyces TaxID=2593676 RepID=UPI0036837F1B
MAYHLARRGILVTLLEQGPAPATGVTGESFAWISSSGSDRPGGFVHENRQPMSTTSGGATAPREFEHLVSRLPQSEAAAGTCPHCVDTPRRWQAPFPQRMRKHVGRQPAS